MKTKNEIISELANLKEIGIKGTQVYAWGMYEDINLGHFYIKTVSLTGHMIYYINKNIGEIKAITAQDYNILRITFEWK